MNFRLITIASLQLAAIGFAVAYLDTMVSRVHQNITFPIASEGWLLVASAGSAVSALAMLLWTIARPPS